MAGKTAWRKSSASFANGNCAEVGVTAGGVGVRDTQEDSHPYRITLVITPVAWREFTEKVKTGDALAR